MLGKNTFYCNMAMDTKDYLKYMYGNVLYKLKNILAAIFCPVVSQIQDRRGGQHQFWKGAENGLVWRELLTVTQGDR